MHFVVEQAAGLVPEHARVPAVLEDRVQRLVLSDRALEVRERQQAHLGIEYPRDFPLQSRVFGAAFEQREGLARLARDR